MRSKVFSRIDDLLDGTAPDNIVNGCMVLEGGAFRGVYTEGVLDFLMQNGINMSCTVGVSAGTISGETAKVTSVEHFCSLIPITFRGSFFI